MSRVILTKSRSFFLYCLVGATGTLVHYTILVGLVEKSLTGPMQASSVGFVFGAIINYLLNYYFTFSSKAAHSSASFRFLSIALLGMIVNYVMMMVLTEPFGIHYFIAQVFATLVVVLMTYEMNKRFTF